MSKSLSFEVVVLEAPGARARSLILKDAERALAEHPTMTTSLPEARVPSVEMELGMAARGDGGEVPGQSRGYPLPLVKVKPRPGNRQDVYLSYQ